MATAQANGIEIAYELTGSGPALVMVMGLGGQLTDWPPGLIDLLSEHFQVITFDNRDIGLSTHFTSQPPTTAQMIKAQVTRRALDAEYQLTDMAADTVGLLDALDIDRAHVCGMSMGGMIAQTLTIDHPQRVMSLTSVMSNTGDRRNGQIDPRLAVRLARRPEPTRETAVAQTLDMFERIGGSSWDRNEHRRRTEISLERAWSPAGTGRQLAAINASPDRTEALSRVTAPTLVIHGIEDPLVRPSGGTATASAVPGSRLLMFPDMGHDLPATRHVEMVEAIRTNADRAAAPFEIRV